MSSQANKFDDKVHLLEAVGVCSLRTACGAAMQPHSDGWSNEVNYWGKIGVRIERPFTTLTLDPARVTCKRKGCRQEKTL
jgi:hypothetical protein